MSQRELVLVLLSAALHAAWNVAAKRHAEPAAFLFLLVGITALAALGLLPFVPLVVWSSGLGLWIALSSALHGLSFIALARAYERGDLSIVYPISRSTPALVPLLAVPWLGERLSLVGMLGIALTLIGMWLVQMGDVLSARLRKASTTRPWHGVMNSVFAHARRSVWAYVMLLLSTGFSIIDKRLMTELGALPWSSPLPRAVVAYFLPTIGAFAVIVPYALLTLGAPKLRAVLRVRAGWISGAALATFASYALTLEALRTAQVSYVVAVRQCSVLFAVVLAVWALRERPSGGRVLGALGTVMGVALIALYA
jgi:drug/metabolite transporter (DMT)-like permease